MGSTRHPRREGATPADAGASAPLVATIAAVVSALPERLDTGAPRVELTRESDGRYRAATAAAPWQVTLARYGATQHEALEHLMTAVCALYVDVAEVRAEESEATAPRLGAAPRHGSGAYVRVDADVAATIAAANKRRTG